MHSLWRGSRGKRGSVILGLTVLMILGLVLAGCSGSGKEPAGDQGGHDHGQVPANYASLENPFSGDQSALEAGKALYDGKCASCHGESGDGKGPGGTGLQPPPADFTDAALMQAASDQQLFWILSEGSQGTAMPGWKDLLSEEQRWQVVNYLRTFAQ